MESKTVRRRIACVVCVVAVMSNVIMRRRQRGEGAMAATCPVQHYYSTLLYATAALCQELLPRAVSTYSTVVTTAGSFPPAAQQQ
jgi:hypothetical protein